MPDVQDGRTYLFFLFFLSAYFVLTSLPCKSLAELRDKLVARFLDKFYDGTLGYIFDKTAALALAVVLLQPFVALGMLPAYGERQRQETLKLILLEVRRQLQLQYKPLPAQPPAAPPAPPAPSTPVAQPEAPKMPATPVSAPAVSSDKLCADGRITGWDSDVLDGASLASCPQGRFVAFVCIDRQPYLVTAGPARTTQIRFYSRDGRDRSSLDETLSPWDEAGFAVSSLSAETFSYFMDGMAARLTMRDRSIYVDLAGVKRAANQSLPACMA